MVKNWKTTLAGLLAGIPFAIDAIMQAYAAGYFTDAMMTSVHIEIRVYN